MFHRPPYYLLHDGKAAGGFLLQTALAVFTVGPREFPSRCGRCRLGVLLATVTDDKSRVCAVGWLKTPEREAFARFSRSLYRNQPMATVAVAEGSARSIPSDPPPPWTSCLRPK